ncbi:cytochrome P450 [Sphingobium aromaticiconvertens]|uniref:cytochrome P450 n=1 Tax=Sphingobium aromaticiconvertens TaxID=365341 RepID=UPI0030194A58
MQQTILADLDIHAPDAREGAETIWARMREADGLAFMPGYGGFHAVARHDDLMTALLDPRLFASGGGITVPAPDGVRSPHIPAEIDPPFHRSYRALLTPYLTPQKVREREPSVRRLVTGLLDGIGDDLRFDFVERVARPLPVLGTIDLLGLPVEDAMLLDGLVVELHEEVATGVRTGAAQKLTDYVEHVITRRQPQASDARADLLSSILLGTVDGRALTLDEQVSMIRLFLIGGFDTTAIALATAIWWLAEHPADIARLRADPALIDSMIEDVVRFASPSTYLRRTVTAPVELGGTQLQAGDQLLLAFGAANRDPVRFDRPDDIVLDRSPNPHLGFGAGHHRCVGSFFAKLEMRVAVQEILARYAHFRLDPDQPCRMGSGLNQGITFLPMVFERPR